MPVGAFHGAKMRAAAIDDSMDDGGPGGEHRRMKFSAKPDEVLHPQAVGMVSVYDMTSGKPGRYMASGDARPAVIRRGALDHLGLPSRVGNRLRWPDGRVTGLDGETPA